MTLRQATLQLAHKHPELRQYLVPILRQHLEAGRAWDGTKGKEYKDSPKRDEKVRPKWEPKPKRKCYYETGDPKDRCYVTEQGGPSGQKKKKTEDWKEYEDERWPGLHKKRPT